MAHKLIAVCIYLLTLSHTTAARHSARRSLRFNAHLDPQFDGRRPSSLWIHEDKAIGNQAEEAPLRPHWAPDKLWDYVSAIAAHGNVGGSSHLLPSLDQSSSPYKSTKSPLPADDDQKDAGRPASAPPRSSQFYQVPDCIASHDLPLPPHLDSSLTCTLSFYNQRAGLMEIDDIVIPTQRHSTVATLYSANCTKLAYAFNLPISVQEEAAATDSTNEPITFSRAPLAGSALDTNHLPKVILRRLDQGFFNHENFVSSPQEPRGATGRRTVAHGRRARNQARDSRGRANVEFEVDGRIYGSRGYGRMDCACGTSDKPSENGPAKACRCLFPCGQLAEHGASVAADADNPR